MSEPTAPTRPGEPPAPDRDLDRVVFAILRQDLDRLDARLDRTDPEMMRGEREAARGLVESAQRAVDPPAVHPVPGPGWGPAPGTAGPVGPGKPADRPAGLTDAIVRLVRSVNRIVDELLDGPPEAPARPGVGGGRGPLPPLPAERGAAVGPPPGARPGGGVAGPLGPGPPPGLPHEWRVPAAFEAAHARYLSRIGERLDQVIQGNPALRDLWQNGGLPTVSGHYLHPPTVGGAPTTPPPARTPDRSVADVAALASPTLSPSRSGSVRSDRTTPPEIVAPTPYRPGPAARVAALGSGGTPAPVRSESSTPGWQPSPPGSPAPMPGTVTPPAGPRGHRR
ncbi:hypothetical protein [Micromonospora sp. NPDC023956]|uniref:hypothetical protein n=1 Tax=Micromonospora sp. NPDC023956 TaxID=3155722 RepID=UPI0033DD135D